MAMDLIYLPTFFTSLGQDSSLDWKKKTNGKMMERFYQNVNAIKQTTEYPYPGIGWKQEIVDNNNLKKWMKKAKGSDKNYFWRRRANHKLITF